VEMMALIDGFSEQNNWIKLRCCMRQKHLSADLWSSCYWKDYKDP